MTTQLQLARKGIVSPQMLAVAAAEDISPEVIREGLADGAVVIPANVNHRHLKPCGIGRGLRTKVNANIGTSSDCVDLESELLKLGVAQEFGADAVMDLSTGGDLVAVRKAILQRCNVALGTVPIYDAGATARVNRGSIVELT